MVGEEERSDEEGSFSNSSIPKRMAIIVAGGLVNIIFALITYIILMLVLTGGNVGATLSNTGNFIFSMVDSLKLLFTRRSVCRQFDGASWNIWCSITNTWNSRICLYFSINIYVTWSNKFITISTTWWR